MSRTLAVVVGVSRSESGAFDSLPGASADAKRFSRALRTWGVGSEDICVLLDESATRAAVLRALRVWPLQGADRMFGSFSTLPTWRTHRRCSNPPRSVLLSYDTRPRTGCNGYTPDRSDWCHRKNPATRSILFIDACRQRIDRIDNPCNCQTERSSRALPHQRDASFVSLLRARLKHMRPADRHAASSPASSCGIWPICEKLAVQCQRWQYGSKRSSRQRRQPALSTVLSYG